MTEKQKKAFLKSEGWVRGTTESEDGAISECWWHAKTNALGNLTGAYRLASRRKRQREARRLKAAGWHWRCASRFHAAKAGYVHADYRGRYTRQEALQNLESQP